MRLDLKPNSNTHYLSSELIERGVNTMAIDNLKFDEQVIIDIQKTIFNFYDTQDIKYSKNEKPKDTLLYFITFLIKEIPICKRNVHFSDVLENSQHISVLGKYADGFRNGADMNIFLSNKTCNPKQPDFFLYCWNIYHLHINNQMNKKRSELQLLCIVSDNDVYFVDVIEHPSKKCPDRYFNIQHLETIKRNNWMEQIGFEEMESLVPNSLEPKITESKDIFKMYTKGINIPFEFDGQAYFPIRGITCAKSPIIATNEIIKITRNIHLLMPLAPGYIGFNLIICNGELCGDASFLTSKNEITHYNIFNDNQIIYVKQLIK